MKFKSLWLLRMFIVFFVLGMAHWLVYSFYSSEKNVENEVRLLLAKIEVLSENVIRNKGSTNELITVKESVDRRIKQIVNQQTEKKTESTQIAELNADDIGDFLLEDGEKGEEIVTDVEQPISALWGQIKENIDLLVSPAVADKIALADKNIQMMRAYVPDDKDMNQFKDSLSTAQVPPEIIGDVNQEMLLFNYTGYLFDGLYNPTVDHKSSLNDLTAFLLDTSGLINATNKKMKQSDVKLKRSSRDFLLNIEENFTQKIRPLSLRLIGNKGFSQGLQAYKSIKSDVDKILSREKIAGNKWYGRFAPVFPNPLLNLILFGLSILSLIAYLWTSLRQTALSRRAYKQEKEKNQMAILQLMDDLAELADGNLAVTATVTEENTGVIADIVNHMVVGLRDLVSTVNSASSELTMAAEITNEQATSLESSAKKQSTEISSASENVKKIVKSIEHVSEQAQQSAVVAQRSVDIAETGESTVRATIVGMDRIRDQIQDTSKRIKRLGESSQEIGDIVALISDIADQTNILALNSAIQASMAGEAGRGFAVVSDEIQRLAERTTSAAKQIETLVRTIQIYANETISSMEETTSEVVRGTELAQNAGVALDEIQSVSQSLSQLIKGISDSSGVQSISAMKVSSIMASVDKITQETLDASQETAASIQRLNNLSGSLKSSIDGFKLPEQTDGSDVSSEEQTQA